MEQESGTFYQSQVKHVFWPGSGDVTLMQCLVQLPVWQQPGWSESPRCCCQWWPWPVTADWTNDTGANLTCTLEWRTGGKKNEILPQRITLNLCHVPDVALLWHGSWAMVAMNGLAAMWLWSCCDMGCCGEVWSCCWNEIGWSVVKPPPTLFMTGTVWGCVEANPVRQRHCRQMFLLTWKRKKTCE